MKPETVSAACKWACYIVGLLGVMGGVFAGAHKMPLEGSLAFAIAVFGLLGSAYLGPAINRLREIRQTDREWAEQYRWRH